MKNTWLSLWRRYQRLIPVKTCFLVVMSSFLGFIVLSHSDVSYAVALPAHRPAVACSASSPADPDPGSLLIVLLDRSGSLIQAPNPTDPNGYSTSVTKALADLWVGQMAVIPFSGDTASLPVLGPSSLADRGTLKNQIQDTATHIGGNTPLAPAMREALALLQQRGNPAGSRVVIITDGNPTGTAGKAGTEPDQEGQIRSQFIPQFCQLGIPVSAVGLEINATSADGQDANRLLSDITSGTNAAYTDVTSPEQLSQVVISLYAQWQKLNFTQEKPQGDNYYVSIDNLAQQATIVTFRTGSNYAVTLTDPNGRRIASPLSTDTHYEIDKLNTGGAPLPGNYTVNVSADPQAQVYALVKSSLGLQFLSPTSKTQAYANQPVQIQAEFLSGASALTPRPGDGQILATVTLLVNGQQVSSNVVNLVQQPTTPVFSGKTIAFQRPGQLRIDLHGTYQQTQLQASFTLSLLAPPPPPCAFDCQLRQHQTLLIGCGIGLLLLILVAILAFWLFRHSQRPRLAGYMSNGQPRGDVDLAELRKRRITSTDLEMQGNFDFGTARFELLQRPDGVVLIKPLKDNTGKISLSGTKAGEKIDVTSGGNELNYTQKIYTDGRQKPSASYESTPGKPWAR